MLRIVFLLGFAFAAVTENVASSAVVENVTSSAVALPPELAFRFKVGRKLGSGNFGTVFSASDTYKYRQAVLKVIKDVPVHAALVHARQHLAAHEPQLRLAAQGGATECGVQQMLHHRILNHKYVRDESDAASHIAACFDNSNPWESAQWILLENAGSRTLDSLYSQGVSLSEASSVVKQVLETLAFMNSKGWTHNDAHAQNWMLTFQTNDTVPFVRLIDFGLALDKASDADLEGFRRHTVLWRLLYGRWEGAAKSCQDKTFDMLETLFNNIHPTSHSAHAPVNATLAGVKQLLSSDGFLQKSADEVCSAMMDPKDVIQRWQTVCNSFAVKPDAPPRQLLARFMAAHYSLVFDKFDHALFPFIVADEALDEHWAGLLSVNGEEFLRLLVTNGNGQGTHIQTVAGAKFLQVVTPMKPPPLAYAGKVPELHFAAARANVSRFSTYGWWSAWEKEGESENVDGEGRSLLHAAVIGGMAVLRKVAEDAPASKQIWCPDINGRTPLHLAAAEREDTIVEIVLNYLKYDKLNEPLCRNFTAQQIFEMKDSLGKTALDLSGRSNSKRGVCATALRFGFSANECHAYIPIPSDGMRVAVSMVMWLILGVTVVRQ